MADQTIIRADDVVITGNLAVSGSQISTSTTNTDIKDRLITLNKGGTLSTNTAGIEIESGGSITATLGYTSAAGWDFGNKNITTTGTISGTLSLAADSVNDTHIDFGTGANQVNTDDLVEGSTNLYFTNARADARISNNIIDEDNFATDSNTRAPSQQSVKAYVATQIATKDNSDEIAEGSTNLYFTNARSRAAISLGTAGSQAYNNSTGVLTIPGTTAHITEDASNKYYTDARADARIAAASINALSDVNTSGISDGKVLMYNGSNFIAQAPAMGVTEVIQSPTTQSGAMTVTDQTFQTNATTSHRVGGSVTITLQNDAFAYISYSANVVQDTGGTTSLALQKSTNGGTSFTTITEFQSNTAGFHQPFSHVEKHTIATGSVEYRIMVKTTAAHSSITYETDEINFTVVEYKVGEFGTVNDLSDVTVTSQQTGQIIYANSGSSWVNQTPTMSPILTSATNNLLRYDGANWVGATPQAVAATITLTDLGSVDTVSASDDGKLLKYDHSSGQFKWTAGIDVITEVVDDTTPQLGGALDVNGNAITGASVSITTSSNGNITLDPDGAGDVRILGDLTVTGTATTMDVTNIQAEDPVMVLNKQSPQPASNGMDAGIMIQRGSSENNTAWYWDEDTDRWKAVLTTTVDLSTSSAATDEIADTSFADIQAGTAHLTATQAQYADLAEIYESDADYEPGTVLIIGGEKEVTQCKILQDPRVVGVVSTNPAYLMNKDGNGVAVALRGKVPCKVEGPVRKGDVLVTNVTPGTATTLTDDSPTPPGFCVIGKSLETDETSGIKLINIIV